MTDSNGTRQSNTREGRVRAASRERRAAQKQELREAILAAASELFLERGNDGFSLRGVAERIGYSATTIYLYFADKDELLFAVVDEGFQAFTAALTAAVESVSDPLAKLEALGRAYVEFGLSHPAHYQLMFMQRPDFLLGHRKGECEPRINGFRSAGAGRAGGHRCGEAPARRRGSLRRRAVGGGSRRRGPRGQRAGLRPRARLAGLSNPGAIQATNESQF